MKTSEYYEDMLSVEDCLLWARNNGLVFVMDKGGRGGELMLKGSKSELNLTLFYDDDHDDLMFINGFNRLRRWKEAT